MNNWWKRLIVLGFAIVAAVGLLLYFGVIHFNNPKGYSVFGVDVSAYQGDIDWDALCANGIDFAFIKATEGSGFVDTRFEYNAARAGETDLFVGFYHFFSFESAGITQAEHFIATVGELGGLLPPAVDVEFYAAHSPQNIDRQKIAAELGDFVAEIRRRYGVFPIIYATRASYSALISGDFEDCPIWIRDVFAKPKLPQGREWTFWQYSDRHRLSGYSGRERYIDMNVFVGDLARLEEMKIKNSPKGEFF